MYMMCVYMYNNNIIISSIIIIIVKHDVYIYI